MYARYSGLKPSETYEQHWGSVTRLRVYRGPSYAKDLEGNDYVADTEGGPRMWLLECDCGYRWEVPEREFPGRRKLRSCGRPECKYTPKRPDARSPKEHGTSISIYIEKDNLDALTLYSMEHRLNFSQSANRILREGLIAMLLSD